MKSVEIYIQGEKQNLKKRVNNSLDTAHHLIRQINEKFKSPEQVYLKNVSGRSIKTKLKYLVQDKDYSNFEELIRAWIEHHEIIMYSTNI